MRKADVIKTLDKVKDILQDDDHYDVAIEVINTINYITQNLFEKPPPSIQNDESIMHCPDFSYDYLLGWREGVLYGKELQK